MPIDKETKDKLDAGLGKLSEHVDYVSGKLFWISVILSVLAFTIVFGVVQIFAILPYITLTHTAWTGLAVGTICSAAVYFVTSRPADMVDTASWALWLTRIALKMANKGSAENQGKDQTAGDKGKDAPTPPGQISPPGQMAPPVEVTPPAKDDSSDKP